MKGYKVEILVANESSVDVYEGKGIVDVITSVKACMYDAGIIDYEIVNIEKIY